MRQRPGLILVLGFGGLLLLMAAAEIASLLLLNTLRQNDAQLQARFLARNRTLEQIRSNIYLSGTYVRDSLLAPEASGARAQLASVEGLRRDTEAAIDSYARSIDPQEAAPFRALRSEIEAYWKVLDRTFAWTPEEREQISLRVPLRGTDAAAHHHAADRRPHRGLERRIAQARRRKAGRACSSGCSSGWWR